MRNGSAVSITYQPGDGSEWTVSTLGPDLEDVTGVSWRGIKLDVDKFLEQLDANERESLEIDLAAAIESDNHHQLDLARGPR